MLRRPLKLTVALCALCALAAAPAASATTLHEPAPSIFSINTQIYDSSHALYVKDIPTARSIGARWVHFTAGAKWTNGRPNFGVLDYEVNTAKKYGRGVLLSLGGIPTACSFSHPKSIIGCPPTTAKDLRTYASFLRTLVLRYRNQVDTYESWLEPNGKSWWENGANPAQYATVLKTQYQVFQSVNRAYGLHLKLLFGGPNSFCTLPQDGWAVLPFVHAVLTALHGQRAFDGIGLHAYRYPANGTSASGAQWGPAAPEWDYVAGTVAGAGGKKWRQLTWPQELTYYEQQFAADGYPNMPMWLTEFGWDGVPHPAAAAAAANHAINDFPSLGTQAAWLRQAYNDILRLPFIKAAFWFNLRNYQPGLSTPDPYMFRVMGLLGYHRYPKPALKTWESLRKAHPRR